MDTAPQLSELQQNIVLLVHGAFLTYVGLFTNGQSLNANWLMIRYLPVRARTIMIDTINLILTVTVVAAAVLVCVCVSIC